MAQILAAMAREGKIQVQGIDKAEADILLNKVAVGDCQFCLIRSLSADIGRSRLAVHCLAT